MSTPQEISAHIDQALAAAETSRRSVSGLVVRTLLSCGALLALTTPLTWQHFGSVARWQSLALVGATWLLFVMTCVTHRGLGAQHTLHRALASLDDVTPRLALLVLLFLSNAVSSLLWAVAFAAGRSFSPREEARHKRMARVLLAGHIALAVALVTQDLAVNALVATIVMIVNQAELSALHALSLQGLRTQAERDALNLEMVRRLAERDRDVLAQELHDSIGAELMALLLSLRRAARQQVPGAEVFCTRAQALLEQLRGAVKILRDRDRSAFRTIDRVDAETVTDTRG